MDKSNGNTLVLAATNRPFDLDPAVLRRFEKRIYIPLPNSNAREKLLHLHLGDEIEAVPAQYLKQIARLTEGYSGSDISILARDALLQPVREAMRATHFITIQNPRSNPAEEEQPNTLYTPCAPTCADAVETSIWELPFNSLKLPDLNGEYLQKSLEKLRPSVSATEVKAFEEWTRSFGTPSSQSANVADMHIPPPSTQQQHSAEEHHTSQGSINAKHEQALT